MGMFVRISFVNKVSFCSNLSEFLNLSCFGLYICECVVFYNFIKFNYKFCYKKVFDKKEFFMILNKKL